MLPRPIWLKCYRGPSVLNVTEAHLFKMLPRPIWKTKSGGIQSRATAVNVLFYPAQCTINGWRVLFRRKRRRKILKRKIFVELTRFRLIIVFADNLWATPRFVSGLTQVWPWVISGILVGLFQVFHVGRARLGHPDGLWGYEDRNIINIQNT